MNTAMKPFWRPGCVLGILLGSLLNTAIAQTPSPYPNQVTIRKYGEAGNPQSVAVSHSFKDGMGRPIMSMEQEGTGDIVAGSKLDAYGRPLMEAKAFYSDEYGHAWQSFDPEAKANAYFNGANAERPNAQGKAFREFQHYSDPLNRKYALGEPGLPYSLANQKVVKTWYLGTNSTTFLPSPTDATLDSWRPSGTMGYTYFLEVTKDPNGKFTQVLKDRMGQPLRAWADPDPGTTGNEIVTQNEYDGNGNLIKIIPPGPGGAPDGNVSTHKTFTYSASGRLISEKHPDEGMTEYVYDKLGQLRFIRKEKQRIVSGSNKKFNYVKYDALGREVEYGVVQVIGDGYFNEDYANDPDFPGTGEIIDVKIRKYYDKSAGLATALDIPEFYLSDLRNLRGRLAGMVAYDDFGQGPSHRVAEIYSYDREGRVDLKCKFIPDLPVQHVLYTYDLQGRLKNRFHSRFQGTTPLTYTSWDYTYDANGRMLEIYRNWTLALRYSYTKTGLISKTEYLKYDSPIGSQTNSYSVRDWLVKTEGKNTSSTLYSEDIDYDIPGSQGPQFNGNISAATHRYWMPSGLRSHFLNYKYDGANRLMATFEGPAFNEGFTYDEKGRINTKMEGTTTYGPYVYEANTNRVVRVGAHPTRNDPNGNFVYDPNGNMVFDRSKKMAVTYDWRGLAVRYRFFTSVPATTLDWTQVETAGPVRAEVQMVYDAEGQRVLKRTNRLD